MATAEQRTQELQDARCRVCNARMWWDDTPDPICDRCAAEAALARVEALEAEIATLRAERQWQPIGTAPKDGTDVLVYAKESDDDDYGQFVARWSASAWWGPSWVAYEHRSETQYLYVTHWMPLPAAPAEGDDHAR